MQGAQVFWSALCKQRRFPAPCISQLELRGDLITNCVGLFSDDERLHGGDLDASSWFGCPDLSACIRVVTMLYLQDCTIRSGHYRDLASVASCAVDALLAACAHSCNHTMKAGLLDRIHLSDLEMAGVFMPTSRGKSGCGSAQWRSASLSERAQGIDCSARLQLWHYLLEELSQWLPNERETQVRRIRIAPRNLRGPRTRKFLSNQHIQRTQRHQQQAKMADKLHWRNLNPRCCLRSRCLRFK